MDTVEIAGMVVIGLASVFGLFSLFLNLIIKPVNELTVSVTKLVLSLEGVNINQEKLTRQVEVLDNRLDIVEHRLTKASIAS